MPASDYDALYEQVSSHTRAGKNGKHINCPYCESWQFVYHFSWCALVCQGCRNEVNKAEWRVHKVKVGVSSVNPQSEA